MKLSKIKIFSLSIISIMIIGLFFISKHEKLNNSANNEVNNSAKELRDYKKINGDTINKKFDGDYLNPLITVVESKPEFNIELEGLEAKDGLDLINSLTGDMEKIEYDGNGNFKLKTKLDKDIDYGILLDYKLVGSIRVVDDLEKTDDNELHSAIMKNLQCGLE